NSSSLARFGPTHRRTLTDQDLDCVPKGVLARLRSLVPLPRWLKERAGFGTLYFWDHCYVRGLTHVETAAGGPPVSMFLYLSTLALGPLGEKAGFEGGGQLVGKVSQLRGDHLTDHM